MNFLRLGCGNFGDFDFMSYLGTVGVSAASDAATAQIHCSTITLPIVENEPSVGFLTTLGNLAIRGVRVDALGCHRSLVAD